MAKQRDEHRQPDPDDPKHKAGSGEPHDEDILSADDLEVVEEIGDAEIMDAELAEDSNPPRPAGRKPGPGVADEGAPSTMLQPGNKPGEAKPGGRPASDIPDLSLGEHASSEEVIEIKDHDVVADDDLFAEEEVVDAEAASSDAGQKTPSPALHAEDARAAEAALQPAATEAEDFDFFGDKDSGERTELLEESPFFKRDAEEPTDQPRKPGRQEVVEVQEDSVLSGDSSPGRPGREQPSGVDAVAEVVESGVDLVGPAEKARPSDEDSAAEMLKEAATIEEHENIFSEAKSEQDEAAVVESDVVDVEEEPGAARRAKRAAEEEEVIETVEEDEHLTSPKGRTAVVTPRAQKSRKLLHWVGGFFLALVVLAVGVTGLAFLSPGLLEQMQEMMPGSRVKDYKAAKESLDAEKALSKKNTEQLTADLDSARKERDKLANDNKGLKDGAQAAQQVRKALAEAKLVPDGASNNDLPKIIGKVVQDKQNADAVLAGVGKALEDAKLVEKDKLDPETLEKAFQDLSSSRAALNAVNKKLEEAKVKASGEKGVGELIAARKQAEAKLALANKALADAKVNAPDTKRVEELIAATKKLEAERNDLDAAIQQAYKELGTAKAADPKEALVAGIKALRQQNQSPLVGPLAQLVSSLASLGTGTGRLLEHGFNTASLLTEVSYYRLREPFIPTPAQQLDMWISLLQGGTRKPVDVQVIVKKADWLHSKDSRATPEVQAKALYVKALALRSQEKHAEAKQALAQAITTAPKSTPWLSQALEAQKELNNPSAYYLPRVHELEQARDFKSALAVLEQGLKVLPGDGRLLAQRSLVRLEMSRPKAPPVSAQKQIRVDAVAATLDPAAAAEGYFALGQLEEALGHWEQAEKAYRDALSSFKGSGEQANRYRIALARVLLQHDAVPVSAPPPPPPVQEKDKVGLLRTRASLAEVLVLALTGLQVQQDEKNSEISPRLKESIDLANELIKSSDAKTRGQGYLLLGQAYARQGRRTEGLKTFVKGLELVYPGTPSRDLEKMVQEHPAFQEPDTLARPNAFLAEREYGKGLHYYWTGQYQKAEDQFNAAIGFYKEDARYYYFLGLARLKQKGKRDAALFALEQGARLEADNHPPAADVNSSLERLQGNLRRYVDQFRQKAVVGKG